MVRLRTNSSIIEVYLRLRPFGTKIVIQIPDQKREKNDANYEEGVFVGYPPDSKGYKVFLASRKMIVSRNVVFFFDDSKDEKSEPNEECESETEDDVQVIEVNQRRNYGGGGVHRPLPPQ